MSHSSIERTNCGTTGPLPCGNAHAPTGPAQEDINIPTGPARGQQTNSGKITAGYCEALRENGLQAFFSEDASVQPGQLQEVMLHETAVSWIRARLTKTLPKKPWEESVDAYRSRPKACAAYCNGHYDVVGLCRALPKRVQVLGPPVLVALQGLQDVPRSPSTRPLGRL